MKDQIKSGYDAMNPSSAQRSRMGKRLLESLPAQSPMRASGHTARAEAPRRWSFLPSAAACLCMVMLIGLLMGRLPDSPPVMETIAQAQTMTESGETIPDADTPFGPGDYSSYLRWLCQERELQHRQRGYYGYYDANGDGVEDLLIGDADGSFTEIITCLDGKLSLLFSVGRSCRVCRDGSILSGREGDESFLVYRLSAQEQSVTTTVWYVEEEDCWYRYFTDGNRKEEISRQQVQELLAQYEPVELDMQPVSDFFGE